MQNITNINFNFELLEDIIIQKLNQYTIVKDSYVEGCETIENLSQKSMDVINAIDCCDECILVRKKAINRLIINEQKQSVKDDLVYENSYLLKTLKWHKKLRESLVKDKNYFINAAFGYEEPDNN